MPRFGLCPLPEHIGDCAPLARQAEAAGFEMLGFVDSQSIASTSRLPPPRCTRPRFASVRQ